MMKRSLERGLGRGAAPKRSRSERGPPVCIISMAQQARPKSMYQSDDLRVQLSMASTWVVTMNSGIVFIKLIGFASCSRGPPDARSGRHVARHALHPLEVALHPHVDETDG